MRKNQEKSNLYKCFLNSVYNNDRQGVESALDKPELSPEADDNFAFRIAAQLGFYQVVKLLIDDPRIDPAVNNSSALRVAAVNGHLETVRVLLACPQIKPHAVDNSAIWGAVCKKRLKVVELLLSNSIIDPGVSNNALVFIALENNDHAILKLLLADKRILLSKEDVNKLMQFEGMDKELAVYFNHNVQFSIQPQNNFFKSDFPSNSYSSEKYSETLLPSL